MAIPDCEVRKGRVSGSRRPHVGTSTATRKDRNPHTSASRGPHVRSVMLVHRDCHGRRWGSKCLRIGMAIPLREERHALRWSVMAEPRPSVPSASGSRRSGTGIA
jgi:hypothetical protein